MEELALGEDYFYFGEMPDSSEEHGIVLFDGVCNLCSWSVNFIIARDSRAYFRFASLQSDYGRRRLNELGMTTDVDSIVLIENGIGYCESTAALRIARRLNGLWGGLYVFSVLPRFLRDRVYRMVATNRYTWFGKKTTCLIPSVEIRDRFVE